MTIPRTIWIYWAQGWSAAPELSRRSLRSWRVRNPGWTVRALDLRKANALLGPEWRRMDLPDHVDATSLSDLLRLSLLERFGGVWVDATTFSARPLDDWLDRHAHDGFFAFARPAKDRPLATWFLSARPGDPVVEDWLTRAWDYWRGADARNGKWVHACFDRLLAESPRAAAAFAGIDAIEARHPLHVGPNAPDLHAPPHEALRAALRGSIRGEGLPVCKLTNRVPLGPEDGRLNWLSRTLSRPPRPAAAPGSHPAQGQAAPPHPTPARGAAPARDAIPAAKPRLILHVGLPKAASTTVQSWADDRRAALDGRGVIYPVPRRTTPMPKHQELVSVLLRGATEAVDDLLTEARPGRVLFLSAEGLTGHLPEGEAAPERLAALRARLSRFETTIFLMTRAREGWLRSYHQQIVRNGPNPAFGYATADPVEVFAETPRVRALLDIPALTERLRAAYAPQDIRTAPLEGDWAEALCDLLGVPDMASDLRGFPRRNEGLSAAATEMLRQANGMDLGGGRRALLSLLRRPGPARRALTPELRDAIGRMTARTDAEAAMLAHLRAAATGGA